MTDIEEKERADRTEKLRKLLALEIDRIVEDLELRKELLLELWSRTRDRGMFLDTVFSRWATLGFPELLELETDQVAAVDTFYRELHELRFYFKFTEDMPVHLADTYDMALERMHGYGSIALETLGGVPDRPYIEFADDEPAEKLPTLHDVLAAADEAEAKTGDEGSDGEES